MDGFPVLPRLRVATSPVTRLGNLPDGMLLATRYYAKPPEQYSVQVNTGTVSEYDVPHDGRIKVEIPAYRRSCGAYLLDAIKIRGNEDPLKSWTVSVRRNGKTVRKQSLRATQKSPTDDAGYHILSISQ